MGCRRAGDNFLDVFKGAPSAPLSGSPPISDCAARVARRLGNGAPAAHRRAGLKPGTVTPQGAACRS
jgi:hypothetical protein